MAKQYSVTVNGNVYDVIVEEMGSVAYAPVATPAPVAAPVAAPAPAAPVAAVVPTPAPAPVASAPTPAANGTGEKVEAPLNGTILSVAVTAGAQVKSGDVLCIVEAMKMENEIVAPKDGTVTSVAAQKGASINAGDVLFTIA